MDLKQEIEEMEASLAKMKAKLTRDAKFWEPTNGKRAWYLSETQHVHSYCTWGSADEDIILSGSVFATAEEAQAELDWRRARYALRKEIFRLNGGETQKLDNTKSRWFVSYDVEDEELEAVSSICRRHHPDWFYIKYSDAARQLVKTHSKELRTYLEN